MKCIDSEWKRDEIPSVHLLIHRLVEEVVDVAAEVTEHRYHIEEEIARHRHLKIRNICDDGLIFKLKFAYVVIF